MTTAIMPDELEKLFSETPPGCQCYVRAGVVCPNAAAWICTKTCPCPNKNSLFCNSCREQFLGLKLSCQTCHDPNLIWRPI